MNPIVCPQCKAEVIPHETHIQRWCECFDAIYYREQYINLLSQEEKIKIAINLFNEINDFIISENIHQGKLEEAKLRTKGASDNIKRYQEANKPKE